MSYYSVGEFYKEKFVSKVYKIAIDAGCTCPTRDGTKGNKGCIFCSANGSGDFVPSKKLSISEQIKQALGIGAVQAEISPWRSKEFDKKKAQIDMLIDRDDRVVNVCEMKFSTNDYTIDKDYDAELRRKLDVFVEETKCRKAIHTTIVTTYGLTHNEYSGRIQNVLTMDDLFE